MLKNLISYLDNNYHSYSMGFKRANLVGIGAALIFLSGCAGHTYVYNSNEELIYHISTKGNQAHELVTPDGYTIKTDSRQKPLFNFDLNALKGAE